MEGSLGYLGLTCKGAKWWGLTGKGGGVHGGLIGRDERMGTKCPRKHTSGGPVHIVQNNSRIKIILCFVVKQLFSSTLYFYYTIFLSCR